MAAFYPVGTMGFKSGSPSGKRDPWANDPNVIDLPPGSVREVKDVPLLCDVNVVWPAEKGEE